MSGLWTVVGIGLCALVTLMLIRELRKEYAPVFLLAFSVLLLGLLLPRFSAAAEYLLGWASRAGGERIEPVVKALGVTVLTSAAGELCRSAGEASVGNAIETAGRLEILLLCTPLFAELLDLALLGG
ncbi:MAG: hypothetical protein IJC71_08220 [Clostridia bacterium]|nr:hypothetical protein [Clostridia bacterium]